MADTVELRKTDLAALSHQLDRFVTHNHESRDERERFAASLVMALKVRIDVLRDRGLEMPDDLRKELAAMLLAEIEEKRNELTRQLRGLDSEECRIKRVSSN